MISDELTIVIPYNENGEWLEETITKISDQTDIQDTRVLIVRTHEENDSFIHSCLQNRSLKIEILQGTDNPYNNRNIGLQECETEFILFIDPGVQFTTDQTIYNCLVELKSKRMDIVAPSLKVPSENLVDKLNNSIIQMRYNQLKSEFPYAPAQFFCARVDTVFKAGLFNTVKSAVDESFELSMSIDISRFALNNDDIIIPDAIDLILDYFKTVRDHKYKEKIAV